MADNSRLWEWVPEGSRLVAETRAKALLERLLQALSEMESGPSDALTTERLSQLYHLAGEPDQLSLELVFSIATLQGVDDFDLLTGLFLLRPTS